MEVNPEDFIDSDGNDSVADYIPYPVDQRLNEFDWKLFTSWALSYYLNRERIRASKRLREDIVHEGAVEVLVEEKNEIRTSKRLKK